MKKIYNSVSELVGNTPLIRLHGIEKKYGLKSRVYAKLEYFNPAGSIKDRVAKHIIEEAEKNGQLTIGATVIEPTSGNTGIGIASIGISKGYKVIIVMPDNMSQERIKMIKGYGADIVLTPAKLGMKGAIEKAEELHSQISGSIIAGQFENIANPDSHYLTTGPELFDDMNGNIDYFISTIGTGGTITGTGKFLKEKINKIKIIGVEPLGSAFITKGEVGTHKIQGIGAGFIPKTLDLTVCDLVQAVSDEDAYSFAKDVGLQDGILVGISSGAALAIAVKTAKENSLEDKNIVVIFPDGGNRYLSTDLYD